MRERVVAAAAELTCESGWRAITMARLAERVGVSRQTVYNEIGSKPALAEAMVMRELAVFLGEVETAFDGHPDDLVAAIEEAVSRVLRLARRNALLQAAVSASYGAETDLLPLLTTRSDALIELAADVVEQRVASYDLPISGRRLSSAVDAVVRVVLSHVVHPTADPATTGEDLAWFVGRVLRT